MKAIFAGGGIGGLTAALCFRHAGWDVEICEQAPEIGEVGAGIQLSPNAMRVMRALGLEAEVRTAGFEPEALEFRDGHTGARVFAITVGPEAERRWGAPYLHIHRADLVEILRRSLEIRAPGAIHLHARAVGYERKANGRAALILSSGGQIEGDALIGADGLHSAIRTQMLGLESPRFTGFVAWRGVVPVDTLGAHVPPPTACLWAGAGRHAVTYRVRGGALANFVGVVEHDDPGEESWGRRGVRTDASSDFEGWHPVIGTLIDNADMLFRWPLYDRAPLPHWNDGPVVLMGDSCHPMLPFLAQGAGMAIEDAWVLARCAEEGKGDLPAAFARFYAERLQRTAAVQRFARSNAMVFHARALLAAAFRTPLWLAGKIAPSMLLWRQDWIFREDVTAA